MTDLRGAHVLVVGATGGLGSALSRQLSAEGAELTLSARSPERLATLATDLGVERTVVADLTQPDGPAAVVRAATDGERQIDAMVYAAGVVAFGPATDLDDDDLDELLLLNLVAPIRLMRAALPAMGKDGTIVNLSAIVAEKPTAEMAAYSATKAALTAFDAALAHELRRAGTRVLDVRPPHTATGLAERPIAGTAPRLGAGLDPEVVARRIVTAIADDTRDLAAADFD